MKSILGLLFFSLCIALCGCQTMREVETRSLISEPRSYSRASSGSQVTGSASGTVDGLEIDEDKGFIGSIQDRFREGGVPVALAVSAGLVILLSALVWAWHRFKHRHHEWEATQPH